MPSNLQCADAHARIVPNMNNKKKQHPPMEATLQTVSSTMTVIRDLAEIQAAMEGRLTAFGKPVLVTREMTWLPRSLRSIDYSQFTRI